MFEIDRSADGDSVVSVAVFPGVSQRFLKAARRTDFLHYAQADATFLSKAVTGGILLLAVCTDAWQQRVLLAWSWWFATESLPAWTQFGRKLKRYLQIEGLRVVVDAALAIKTCLAVSSG